MVDENTPAESQNGGFLAVSRPVEREAARTRQREYPYRFPRDHRQMDGQHILKVMTRLGPQELEHRTR